VIGGVIGGFLLLHTGEKLFQQLVPFLILLASILLALSDPMRAWVLRRSGKSTAASPAPFWAVLPIALASAYGGYFGAGMSVIVLAVLGLLVNDNLTRLNALKQGIAFSANVAAAIFFLFSGRVVWTVALVMMVGSLLGGVLGGKLAGKVKPATLRWIVVVVGVVVGIIYLLKNLG